VTRSKLRITLLGLNYAPEPTGNAPYTASLAEGLAAAGHTVHVVTGYPHYPEWTLKKGYSGWASSEVINGVCVQRLRHSVPSSPNPLARLHMELSFGLRLMFARWGKPDVVLLVSPALFSSALAMLRVRLRPNRPALGIWVQDLYSRGVVETGTGGGKLAWLSSAIESLILRSADGVVAIHDRFKHHIVNSLNVPSDDVKVIRNWTHLPSSPESNRDEIRARLGWAPEETVVLHAGNMGKKQGLENVVNAARLAQEKDSPVRFVLMGDGNQRQNLQMIAADLKHLQFVPPLPGREFMEALAAADILLVNELPGVRDMSVPSKLTSYYNAGVPVIAATDKGSVTAGELEFSRAGMRVDAADPHALLEAAEELWNDRNAASAMGSRGLKFRNETLSEATAIGHYNDFITSLATSRGR
jgi:colanic acid biosynthesis glycosyl transferase WcaI